MWLPTGERAVEVDAHIVNTSTMAGDSTDLPLNELVDLLKGYATGKSDQLTEWWEAVGASDSSNLRAVSCTPLMSNTSTGSCFG